MKRLFLTALFGLAACAQNMVWDKPGVNQADFNRDDYACRKDAIASGGTTYVGFGVTARNADADMYQRCMVASGYTLRQSSGPAAQNNSDAIAAFKSLTEQQEGNCVDPKFAPYYSKTACRADRMSFEQLADTTKISPAAKTIFVDLRTKVDGFNRQWADLNRKYAGAVGAKRADVYLGTTKIQDDKNNLDLFNGAITWGEYNRRRQQIYSEYQAATKS